MSRADGYPGFSKAYGLKFREVREMDLSLTYIALSSNQVDLIAGNSTEGRIATLDLVQLTDNRRYFPPYEAVYLVRQDSLARVPALREVLSKLANAISTDEMRRLNSEIDEKKRDPKEVVKEWIAGRKGAVNPQTAQRMCNLWTHYSIVSSKVLGNPCLVRPSRHFRLLGLLAFQHHQQWHLHLAPRNWLRSVTATTVVDWFFGIQCLT